MSKYTESSGSGELADLIPLAYDQLRQLARNHLANLRPGGTLAPTDLVNEVLLRLLKNENREYQGTDHLIRVAAQAMHFVLVDQARRRIANKRGGRSRNRVELDDDLSIAAPAEDMLVFHEACEAVRLRSDEHYELLLLRIYAGMSIPEIAVKRGHSERTVARQWRFVKAVLQSQIDPNGTWCA